MTDLLAKLFDSPTRVRLFRLFLLNPQTFLARPEIKKRTKASSRVLARELNLLKSIKFIVAKKTRPAKKTGFILNPKFSLIKPLKNLVINTELFKDSEILRRLQGVGRLKLLIVAGVFIYDENSRADILVVGDSLKRSKIEAVIRAMEAQIGKELQYAIFDSKEFEYRLNVYDRFLRDILDYPHRKIVNKLGI